jgi:ribonuclease E
MPKTMLINVTHAEESRVGIVTDGVLSAFEIESFSREHLKGNMYRGVVRRIHPALEAAFVDIGADRDAFLPLDEVCFRNLPKPVETGGNGSAPRQRIRIQEAFKPGDELLVQIVKEQFANKPPTLSTFYSLPGRYLVLLPGSDESGISRRIEGEERVRIRELIDKLHPPEGFGIIVRTVAGFDQGARELQRDIKYLLRLWEKIQQSAASKRAPALVYREHDLVLRNIRDYFTPDIDEIYIDNEEVFQRAREFLAEVMPGKENVLRLYEGEQPIFSQFDVEGQIESIYKRRVPLPSGGSIVIDGTEALTAIDVNSGRSVRGANQEQTAFRTNREAAVEIARQLRLRDVGGLIVIDFIDMKNPQHVSEIERTLRHALHEDKARHEVGRISHFGLLEVSRQRLRPAAAATSYVACTMCEGHGLVRTPESAALVALRKIHNRVAKGDVALLRVSMPPEVGLYLLNQKRDAVAQLERRYALRIQVALDDDLMPHQSEFEIRSRAESEKAEPPQLRLGGVAAPEPAADQPLTESDRPAGPQTGATTGTGVRPRRGRRRRGRRRRGRGGGTENGAAVPLEGSEAASDEAIETPEPSFSESSIPAEAVPSDVELARPAVADSGGVTEAGTDEPLVQESSADEQTVEKAPESQRLGASRGSRRRGTPARKQRPRKTAAKIAATGAAEAKDPKTGKPRGSGRRSTRSRRRPKATPTDVAPEQS